MTEDDARAIVADRVPRETYDALHILVSLVTEENERQNLVAPSTILAFWSRHILDSLQLVWLAEQAGVWLDIGSGGGFPGLVVAVAREAPTVLVEPRSKRAAFLKHAASCLRLDRRATVIPSRVETAAFDAPVSTISARAVAALPAIFAMASGAADDRTLWLLPKGRSAGEEVAEARREWQGDFRLVASLSDSESAIVSARRVRRIRGR